MENSKTPYSALRNANLMDLVYYSEDELGENEQLLPECELSYQKLLFSKNSALAYTHEEKLKFLTKLRRGLEYSLDSLVPPSAEFLQKKIAEIQNLPELPPGSILSLLATLIIGDVRKR